MTLKYIWRSFSLGCHFHVHFSYPWHGFASHGLPAIAELLVVGLVMVSCVLVCLCMDIQYIICAYNCVWCYMLVCSYRQSFVSGVQHVPHRRICQRVVVKTHKAKASTEQGWVTYGSFALLTISVLHCMWLTVWSLAVLLQASFWQMQSDT